MIFIYLDFEADSACNRNMREIYFGQTRALLRICSWLALGPAVHHHFIFEVVCPFQNYTKLLKTDISRIILGALTK